MKISEMKYERLDVNDAVKRLSALTEKMRLARSGKEMAEIRKEAIEESKRVQTMRSLAYVRFTLNTADAFYEGEQNYYDETVPLIMAEGVKFDRAFLNNPHVGEALEYVNPNVAKTYELSLKIMDDKIVKDLAKEAKLVTKYDRLLSEKTFYFKGKNMPLPTLRKYIDDANRSVRKSATETLGKGLSEISKDLDGIFDDLVKVRSTMAKKMGYSSYAEMGDDAMGRYSYGRREIKKFRRSVLNDVTPLVARRRLALAKELGITDFKLYDNEIYFKDGNPAPTPSPEEMFEVAKRMYHDLGKETGEFIDNMLTAEAFDVFARKGKWGGGYCTSIDGYAQPFILANFNGSSGDVDVLTHEAGHAFAYYEFFRSGADYELNLGTMSVAEIHSMAMEFFAWKYMDGFFGKRADDYKYMHLLSSLTFLPYGAQVDEFQEICYDHPDLTPDERCKEWNRLDGLYRPYLTAQGLPYLERGTRWQYQMHIYETPMYYIDYCLSQAVAHQFLAESMKDYDGAFEKYVALVSKAGSLPFQELVTSAGLTDPLAQDGLKSTTLSADKILDKLKK